MAGTFIGKLNPKQSERYLSNYRSLILAITNAISDRTKAYGMRVGLDSDDYHEIVDRFDKAIYDGEITPDTDLESYIDPEREWRCLQLILGVRESFNVIRAKKPQGSRHNREQLLALRNLLSSYDHQFRENRVVDQYILMTLRLVKNEINIALSFA